MTDKNPSRFFLFLSLLLCSAWVAAIEIQSTVSRDPIGLDESFQLTLQAMETPAGEPDFSPLLRNFEILSQNQSQNIQMTNGEVTRNLAWNLVLMPKQAGVLEIPGISFGGDVSATTSVTVTEARDLGPADKQDDIFIELAVEPGTAYVQQQVVLRVQLFNAARLASASLSEPETDNPDTIISKLGEDSQFETRIDNRRYTVIERKYALFPQHSGKLRINPIVFQGEVISPRSSSLDNFFGDRLGSLNRRGQLKRLRSETLELDVKPARPGLDPWLPSSNLQLVETWGQQMPEFKVGEPVTRSFMLLADGLTAVQLPPISLGQPDGVKQYPEQPTLNNRPGANGTTGIRQEKVALIPTRAGTLQLPAIEIDWWNTEKDRLETASIPEREVQVLPAGGDTAFQSAPLQTAQAEEKLTPAEFEPVKNNRETSLNWLAILLGAGWALTALAWWAAHRQQVTRPVANQSKPAGQQPAADSGGSNTALRQACRSNDPQAASRELLRWAALRWPDEPPLSLGGIGEKSGNLELASAIKGLEAVLYAPEQLQWDGEELWNIIQQLPRDRAPLAGAESAISPLYPA